MKITVDIDDETLSALINTEIQSLPKEVISNIAVEAIRNYINREDVLDRILFTERQYLSGKEMSDFLRKSLDYEKMSDKFDDIREMILQFVKENHKQIILEVLVNSFSRSFVTDEFREGIVSAIRGDTNFKSILE